MNSLSWMIYLADVVGGLNGFLAAITAGGIFWIAGALFYGATIKDNYGVKIGDEEWMRGHAIQKKATTKIIFIPLAAMAISIPLPSKSTIYAIAASEMGEKSLQSETGGKAIEALNAWLDRQIKGDTGK